MWSFLFMVVISVLRRNEWWSLAIFKISRTYFFYLPHYCAGSDYHGLSVQCFFNIWICQGIMIGNKQITSVGRGQEVATSLILRLRENLLERLRALCFSEIGAAGGWRLPGGNWKCTVQWPTLSPWAGVRSDRTEGGLLTLQESKFPTGPCALLASRISWRLYIHSVII